MENLYKLVKCARAGEAEAMEALVERFMPLLRKHARELGYEDALEDLILFLIETVPSIPLGRIGQENIGGLVRYIQAAVWHQLPKLRRRQREIMGYLEDLPLEVESPRSSLEEEVNFRLWLRPLTEKQKRIIQMSYLYQLSDQEIAGILRVSRQAVYKIRQSAIKKLRKEWQ